MRTTEDRVHGAGQDEAVSYPTTPSKPVVGATSGSSGLRLPARNWRRAAASIPSWGSASGAGVAIRLLIKYSNLRLMTSAWSPKRLPDNLLHYMRTRGPDKVIYASDWPVLTMRRVIPEALALDLSAGLENYLCNNAHTFFFEGH